MTPDVYDKDMIKLEIGDIVIYNLDSFHYYGVIDEIISESKTVRVIKVIINFYQGFIYLKNAYEFYIRAQEYNNFSSDLLIKQDRDDCIQKMVLARLKHDKSN